MAQLQDKNRIEIRGHLGLAARTIPSQSEDREHAGVALRVVTNRYFGPQDNRRKATTGFDVTCWGDRGMEYAELPKGAHVSVVGRVEFRPGKTQAGADTMFCNVIAQEVVVLSAQPSAPSAPASDDPGPGDEDAPPDVSSDEAPPELG